MRRPVLALGVDSVLEGPGVSRFKLLRLARRGDLGKLVAKLALAVLKKLELATLRN